MTPSVSLFLSPTFLVVEIGFLLGASIAAYELFIGDFTWAREEEEERRKTMQNRRGRRMVSGIVDHSVVGAGFESLDSRQLYPHARREYHRSLSPGHGRGGNRAVGGGTSSNSSSRRGSGAVDEETSLLASRSRGIHRSTGISEGGYYASPGDTRYSEGGRGSPGRGSTGDTTRRLVRDVLDFFSPFS